MPPAGTCKISCTGGCDCVYSTSEPRHAMNMPTSRASQNLPQPLVHRHKPFGSLVETPKSGLWGRWRHFGRLCSRWLAAAGTEYGLQSTQYRVKRTTHQTKTYLGEGRGRPDSVTMVHSTHGAFRLAFYLHRSSACVRQGKFHDRMESFQAIPKKDGSDRRPFLCALRTH